MAKKVIKPKAAPGKRHKPKTKRANARAGKPRPAAKVPPRKGVVSSRAKKPPPRDVGPLDLIGEAWAEVVSLAEEMRTWADNMEDSLSNTQKYADVSEAAETLENLDEPTTDITALNDHKLSWQDPTPRRRGFSRAMRCGHACDMLRAAEEKLRELVQELPEDDAQHDAADGLADEVENLISELEGVAFLLGCIHEYSR